MEIILISFISLVTTFSIYLNVFHFYRLNQRLEMLKERTDGLGMLYDVTSQIAVEQAGLSRQIDGIGHGLDRSLLAMRENLEATKPMKSNNWDSVREAFKGPVRIDLNERN